MAHHGLSRRGRRTSTYLWDTYSRREDLGVLYGNMHDDIGTIIQWYYNNGYSVDYTCIAGFAYGTRYAVYAMICRVNTYAAYSCI